MGQWIGRAIMAAVLVTLPLRLGAQSNESVNTSGRRALAVHGYDVVSYAADAAAVPGRAELEYRWNGALWRFASAAHRDRFAAEPERYAPQYGGYCAWAVSRGYTADIDPQAWRIVDGKLYLNYSKRVQRMWESDIPGNVAKANGNWPKVAPR